MDGKQFEFVFLRIRYKLNLFENDQTLSFYDQVEHPSALDSFDQMMKAAKGKKIVVFLDYDGTLSPIVNDPDSAFMSNEVCHHLFYKHLNMSCVRISIMKFFLISDACCST